MKRIDLVVALFSFVLWTDGSMAQPASSAKYPDRPLRYIVPFPPGGSTDIVARVVAAALTEELGEQVVIDNRAGAGGTVGAEIAARSTPDGYNLFACNIASLAVSPALYRKLGYDPANDFVPIGLVGSNPNSLVVHPSVPSASVSEFIALVKSQPGKLNYGSAGVGTSPQLSMELFKMTAGLDITHIAYKGAGPAVADLIGGHLHAMFATVPSVLGGIRGGKIRILAVTSTKRAADLPDVPTLDESGMPGFEVISWQGLCAPKGTPQHALDRLRSALARSLGRPTTRKQLADQGIQIDGRSAKQFAAFIRSEHIKWAKVVKDIGITPR
ncbi:MAG: tripartite tricarboxylate transporter substrate binding protein [Burkholderiales bacterium]|nr:tripartite tricarboxylate transporter substrate binding protein [Burkholderiales bacterium]